MGIKTWLYRYHPGECDASDGYHYPVGDEVVECALESDNAACLDAMCAGCGHEGLDFEPRVNSYGSYIPYMHCPECGRVEAM
jgi:hypothetical protein